MREYLSLETHREDVVVKKFVPWIAGLVIAASIVVIAISYFGALSAQAENARWFHDKTSGRMNYEFTRRNGWVESSDLPARSCVESDYYGENAKLVDDFNSCITRVEGGPSGLLDKMPSEACMALAEKSREQLQCIVDAELPIAKAARAQRQAEELKYQKKWEAEQKAQEAKDKAADEAVTPSILKAIADSHPNTDAERRQAAILVSCEYEDDSEAGYRVSLKQYAKASQKGVDATDRFDSGRYAICNQQQASDRVEQTEAVNRQVRDWAYYPPNR